MFSPTITTFSNLAPPWSLPVLDANFAAINAMLANGASWAAAAGTADAITATYVPANTTLTDGLILGVRATAANATTTPTFAPDGLSAHTITKQGGVALVAGDIPGGLAETLLRYNLANTRWELLNPAGAATSTAVTVPVRQTVLSGPIDANGLPNFGGATGSGTVTQTGTLVVTAANGATLAAGGLNRIGSGTNLSWTGLTTNGTMYLYVLVNSDGTLTTGSTTTAPVYQWGGSFSNTSGAFVYNIQTMTGNLGTGAANAQAYLTFVGQVTVAGAVVTVITWYAIMARFTSALTVISAAGTANTFTHNIGVDARWINQNFGLQNVSTQGNYAVGDSLQLGGPAAGGGNGITYSCGALTASVNASAAATIANKTTGALFGITIALWNYYCNLTRTW